MQGNTSAYSSNLRICSVLMYDSGIIGDAHTRFLNQNTHTHNEYLCSVNSLTWLFLSSYDDMVHRNGNFFLHELIIACLLNYINKLFTCIKK